MNVIYIFLTVIAVIVGIYSTILAFVSIRATLDYPNSVDNIVDKAHGVTRTYPWKKYTFGATICWSWVITVVVVKWLI